MDNNFVNNSCKFKRLFTKEYTQATALDNIDIEAALKKNKEIPKCKEEDFIYDIEGLNEDKSDIVLEDMYFTLNDQTHKFTSYFTNIKIIGKGKFGTIVSCIDPVERMELAVKVGFLLKSR